MESRRHLTPATAVFAVALFLGSLLMFLAEPMIAKMLLPHMGGAPMVWNTCVVFFQTTLLAGYAYAHGARRLLGPSRHILVYAALLVLPAATLPIALPESLMSPVAHPTGWLLLALTTALGLPFFVLAASTSGLQTWFAAADHPGSRDPYFLYAASNLGSLLALMLYPTVIEPRLSLAEQSRLWAAGYATFTVAALACTVLTWRSVRGSLREPALGRHSDHASWQQRGTWIVLSLIPSSLLLGVTSYLSTDVASVPLLWVAPLSLYLLTFVVAFGSRTNRWGEVADGKVPLLVSAVTVFLTPVAGLSVWFAVPLHLSAFAAAALACHGRLAAKRPAPSLLTEFYFCVACGGLLGGLFNTLLVPVTFDSMFEYPFMLLCASVVGSLGWQSWRELRPLDGVFPLVTFALTTAVVLAIDRTGVSRLLMVPGLALAATLSFSQAQRRIRFALSIASILIAASLANSTYGRVLHRERTFFGVYRVSVDSSGLLYSLFHGTTLHGVQAREPDREKEPLTYYHWSGPFGQAFEGLPQLAAAHEVAVVGLGVGSLAAYARAGQTWTFYEIDPAVERIARDTRYFTFLRDCAERCRVVLGDARLSLDHAASSRFGLIVLDAFSSDAIPVHLLTREALSMYLARLSRDGILAFHISNRHLRLAPVLARVAASHRLTAIRQRHSTSRDQDAAGQSGSEWMLMAREERHLAPLLGDSRWTREHASPSTPLWTDDFSNVLSVLDRP